MTMRIRFCVGKISLFVYENIYSVLTERWDFGLYFYIMTLKQAF